MFDKALTLTGREGELLRLTQIAPIQQNTIRTAGHRRVQQQYASGRKRWRPQPGGLAGLRHGKLLYLGNTLRGGRNQPGRYPGTRQALAARHTGYGPRCKACCWFHGSNQRFSSNGFFNKTRSDSAALDGLPAAIFLAGIPPGQEPVERSCRAALNCPSEGSPRPLV